MKKEEYYDYQIEYLQNNEYESLDDEDLENLLSLRNLNKRRKQHQRWIDKHQKIIDEYNRREQLLKDIRKEERIVFDDVSLLKKTIFPYITIYKKDETSKSLKNKISHYQRNTYKGEPLKKREIWYCTIRMRTNKITNQKNIYLGNSEKVQKVLNWYNDVKTFSRSDNQIKNQTTIMLMDFFVPHLKDGWEKFTSNNYSLEKVIYPYLKELKIKRKSIN